MLKKFLSLFKKNVYQVGRYDMDDYIREGIKDRIKGYLNKEMKEDVIDAVIADKYGLGKFICNEVESELRHAMDSLDSYSWIEGLDKYIDKKLERIDSEEFIDSLVERIKRKQL